MHRLSSLPPSQQSRARLCPRLGGEGFRFLLSKGRETRNCQPGKGGTGETASLDFRLATPPEMLRGAFEPLKNSMSASVIPPLSPVSAPIGAGREEEA